MLEALLGLHLDDKEVLAILFEFAIGRELIVEGSPHLLEVSKRVARKRVETVGDDPLKAGRENSTNEEVIMRIDRHLIMVVLKMLDGAGRAGVEVKAQHHELHWETVRHVSIKGGELGILRLPPSSGGEIACSFYQCVSKQTRRCP